MERLGRHGYLLLLVVALAAALPVSAVAQSGAGAGKVRLSAPAFAAGGETLLLCAASAGGGHVTAEILDGTTGAIVITKQLTLPTFGSVKPPSVSATVDTPPDPCLVYTPSASALFIGRIALNPQPLPPGIVAPDLNPQPLPPGIVASLQIFTGTLTAPANVRIVGFEPPDPCFQASSDKGCLF